MGPLNHCVLCHNHLGDAFAVLDGKGEVGVVDEQDFDFATVIGVDGAWAIEYGNAVFECQTAAGPHLCFVSFGEFDEESGGDERTFLGV